MPGVLSPVLTQAKRSNYNSGSFNSSTGVALGEVIHDSGTSRIAPTLSIEQRQMKMLLIFVSPKATHNLDDDMMTGGK